MIQKFNSIGLQGVRSLFGSQLSQTTRFHTEMGETSDEHNDKKKNSISLVT